MGGDPTVTVDPKLAFGRAVRAMRVERGVSQEDLAHRCNMSRATLSKVETGQADLRLTSIFRLACGLDIAVTDLVSRAEAIRRVTLNGSKHT